MPAGAGIEPQYQVENRRRAERWGRAVVALGALMSVSPISYFVGERNRGTFTDWMLAANDWLPAEGDQSPLENGAAVLSFPVLFVAVIGFVVLMWIRRHHSRRVVERSAEAGIPPVSTTALSLAVLAWSILLVGATVFGAAQFVGEGENTSEVGQRFIDNPWWMFLTPVGLAVAVAMSHWHHRRRYHLEPLGLLRPVDRDGPPSFRMGLRMYGRALVIESGFGVATFTQRMVNDAQFVDPAEFVETWLIQDVLLFPAMLTGLFLLMFACVPGLGWMVSEVFAQPLTRVSFALFGAAFALVAVSEFVESWLLVATVGVVALVGALIANVTGLYVHDVGPQPWLGFLFLLLIYMTSAFMTESGGSPALPSGPFTWAMAVVLGVYTFHQMRKLWYEPYPSVISTPNP